MPILKTLLSQLNSQNSHTYWIAYSGGLDSHVLLHACAALQSNVATSFRAVHIHHGLSPHASHWEEHCKQVCADLQLQYHSFSVNAKPQSGKSPEAVAREARYSCLENLIGPDECLLVAHHQDDQAETVLLQLFRGAGPAGLAAMPSIAAFGKGSLLRPFLGCRRADLLAYAEANDLHWIEDESNFDTSYDRNFIRHTLMPVVRQRWPAAASTLSRVALNQADALELLEEMGREDLAKALVIPLSHVVPHQRSPNPLPISYLQTLSITRQHHLIRTWLRRGGFSVPSRVQLQQLTHDFLSASTDAQPCIAWEGVEVRRYRGELYAMKPLQPFDPTQEFVWDTERPLILPGDLGQLEVQQCLGEGFHLSVGAMLLVRFRRGGEVCGPAGRGHTHELKKLFQEWGVPPWIRDRVPLLYYDEKLVAVIGFCVCEDFKVSSDQIGNVLIYTSHD